MRDYKNNQTEGCPGSKRIDYNQIMNQIINRIDSVLSNKSVKWSIINIYYGT